MRANPERQFPCGDTSIRTNKSQNQMSNWNKNNAAHFFTWLDLIFFYELPKDRKFSESEDYKTRNLLFYADTADGVSREKRAKALSTRLDDAFRGFHGAKLEAGRSRTSAIIAMTETLLGTDKTVGDLARIADDFYQFHTEVK
jgi:hypothetical protein